MTMETPLSEDHSSNIDLVRSLAISQAELWHEILQRLAEVQQSQVLLARSIEELGGIVRDALVQGTPSLGAASAAGALAAPSSQPAEVLALPAGPSAASGAHEQLALPGPTGGLIPLADPDEVDDLLAAEFAELLAEAAAEQAAAEQLAAEQLAAEQAAAGQLAAQRAAAEVSAAAGAPGVELLAPHDDLDRLLVAGGGFTGGAGTDLTTYRYPSEDDAAPVEATRAPAPRQALLPPFRHAASPMADVEAGASTADPVAPDRIVVPAAPASPGLATSQEADEPAAAPTGFLAAHPTQVPLPPLSWAGAIHATVGVTTREEVVPAPVEDVLPGPMAAAVTVPVEDVAALAREILDSPEILPAPPVAALDEPRPLEAIHHISEDLVIVAKGHGRRRRR